MQNILLVSASHRQDSNSMKLAQYIERHYFAKREVKTSILELSATPDLFDHYGEPRENHEALVQQKEAVLKQLYQCDAVVFLVPEWGGMVPPALVNLLLLCANGSASGLPLGHKPAFVVGISSSGGGTYPVSMLKGYAGKNTHLVWTPLHAIVQNVASFIEQSWQPEVQDRMSQVQSRLVAGLDSLLIYAEALKPQRDALVKLSQVHPFGQ